MGFDEIKTGEIAVFGKKIARPNPLNVRRHGIALIPEDRKTQGIILENSVTFNTSIAVLDRFISWLRVNRKKEQEIVNRGIESMAVKTPSVNQRVVNLSGGNQQKVVLAKWLATEPKILIMDEPTRGIDVGAKAEIYRTINDLAAQGIGIIMVSSELNEVINMSDRLAIMWEGSIATILEKKDFSQDRILKHALGGMK
jgi:ribose transport system ATP-binding protein/inositol transport system ATP-binding protein